jgi:acetyl esterase/lipase
MTGTRDFFLSATTNFHRALLRAGVSAQLLVFDAMPHEHWTQPGLPEAEEALDLQARFLAEQVGAAIAPATP